MTTKVYAVAPDELHSRITRLTPGKKYEAYFDGVYTVEFGDDGEGFNIINDVGTELYCLWEGCGHLNGDNWTRVEEEEE